MNWNLQNPLIIFPIFNQFRDFHGVSKWSTAKKRYVRTNNLGGLTSENDQELQHVVSDHNDQPFMGPKMVDLPPKTSSRQAFLSISCGKMDDPDPPSDCRLDFSELVQTQWDPLGIPNDSHLPGALSHLYHELAATWHATRLGSGWTSACYDPLKWSILPLSPLLDFGNISFANIFRYYILSKFVQLELQLLSSLKNVQKIMTWP